MKCIILDINECASNPCKNNATCKDDVNSYTCQCIAGYDGLHCGKSKYLYICIKSDLQYIPKVYEFIKLNSFVRIQTHNEHVYSL